MRKANISQLKDNRIKKDIQAEITQYQTAKENYPDPVFADSYDSWISDLETELADAPDSYPAAGDYSADDYVGALILSRKLQRLVSSKKASIYAVPGSARMCQN